MSSAYAHAPLILDTAGATLDANDRRRIAHPLVGGVVLFARHWRGRDALVHLCAAIKDLRDDVIIFVDHEGGRVQRFADDGFTPLPPMRAVGRLWDRDPLAACDAASAIGFVLASELRACGVDLSFAPVLDIDHGPSGVIGSRAFHRDPRSVTLLTKSVMHGMLLAGMANVGKHFPGHGYAKADSHVALPLDQRSLKAILADDALPYAHLSSVLAAVMPAHVIYPKVDKRPAGFSPCWLQDVLRQQLGFSGCIVSDDLSMAAARQVGGQTIDFAAAATTALNAGCDLVTLCNQSLAAGGHALDEWLELMAQGAARGHWQPSTLSEQRRQALLPQTEPMPWDALMVDACYRQALERVADVAAMDG